MANGQWHPGGLHSSCHVDAIGAVNITLKFNALGGDPFLSQAPKFNIPGYQASVFALEGLVAKFTR